MTLIPTKQERKRWLKKTKTVLSQPITIGHAVLVILTLLVASLTMGTAPTSQSLVARAESLTPPPVTPATPQPLVKVDEVKEAPKQEPPKPSGSVVSAGGSGRVLAGNKYPWGQCTWWVYNQTGRGQNGNAGTWGATSSVPRVGAIMIYRPGQYGAGSAGHVGVVVSVNGNQITVSSMNWSGVGRVVTHVSPSTGLFY